MNITQIKKRRNAGKKDKDFCYNIGSRLVEFMIERKESESVLKPAQRWLKKELCRVAKEGVAKDDSS